MLECFMKQSSGFFSKKDVTAEFLSLFKVLSDRFSARFSAQCERSKLPTSPPTLPPTLVRSLLQNITRGEEITSPIKRFLEEHRNDHINFYATPVNSSYPFRFLSFICGDKKLLEMVLAHPSMRDRRDHHLPSQASQLFDALGMLFFPHIPAAASLSRLPLITFIESLPRSSLKDHDIDLFYTPLPQKPSAAFTAYFQNYPQKEIWRLFYDVDKQRVENAEGWGTAEKIIPGFFQGMTEAFLFLKNSIDSELSVDLLEGLHNGILHKGIRTPDANAEWLAHFKIEFGYNTSLYGLAEIFHSSRYGQNYYLGERQGESSYRMICSGVNVRESVETVIQKYHEMRKTSGITPKKRLLNIVELVGELIRIHPFPDGNCRTICTLLLMRELMHNGFPPAMLDDPNRMAGYSREECVAEIVKGMQNFQRIKNLGWDKNTFGKSTDEILVELTEKKQDNYVKQWHEALAQFQQHHIGIDTAQAPTQGLAPGK